LGAAHHQPNNKHMTKIELLSDVQTEQLAGGRGRGPSLTSTTSSMDITNLISQSNVGSAWASGALAGAGTGHRGGGRKGNGGGGETEVGAEATNIQKNFLALNNFGFSLAF
jgi:hypothetical protein